MPTHNIRITRILYIHISLRFLFLTAHAVRVKWSEVVAVGQTLWSISSQAGLQFLNVLVILMLSQSSFNYDTDQEIVWRSLGDWHCGLETFILGSSMRIHASLASSALPLCHLDSTCESNSNILGDQCPPIILESHRSLHAYITTFSIFCLSCR